MQIFAQAIIFFLIVGILNYLSRVKNFRGMGENTKTKKEAFKASLIPTVVATIVFTIIIYISQSL